MKETRPAAHGSLLKAIAATTFAMAMAAAACPALAATPYPTKPIRLITANAAGGSADALLRGVAEVLARELGQPAVVENKPGGEGIIAGQACADAPPDGHTLCMVDSFNMVLLPLIRKKLPYDPSQFAPITLLGFIPSGFWVNASVPAQTVQEFVALARQKPGTVTLGSWGRSSTPYLYGELFKYGAHAQFNVVPYKSPTNAWQATSSGEVNATIYSLAAGMPMRTAGMVKLLAVNTDARMPALPDVPTFAESGLPAVIVWLALYAPPATPPDVIEKINAALAKGLFANAAVREKLLTSQGYLATGPVGGSPETMDRYLKSQMNMYNELAGAARLSPE